MARMLEIFLFVWWYTLRVQVPNNHILTQNLYYNYYYPKPKYLIIGYLDPLGYLGNSKFQVTGHGTISGREHGCLLAANDSLL